MLNPSDNNSIASTFQPNVLRPSTCPYRWIDDAIFYDILEDRYHLVSVVPIARAYLGFRFPEESLADLPPLVVD
jgi:hypothetical protein